MEREEDKDREKGFKVQDRRRFSSEGELKPEFSGDEPPPAPASSIDTAAASTAAGPASPKQSETVGAGPIYPGAESNPAEISFATFVVGLSTEALVHLGEIPDPQTGQHVQNLAAAQQLIDIVAMLQSKTRGNLDQNEQALVDAILFDLRMKYVERARPAPR